MKSKINKLSIFLIPFLFFSWSRAEKILVEDDVKIVDSDTESNNLPKKDLSSNPPKVGRSAAQKYFVKNSQDSNDGINTRLLSLHIGGYLKSKSQDWGTQTKSNQVGIETIGVTYKIGEWVRTMDLNLRIDYFQYEIDNEKPIKISFLPLLTFPDAATDFPLYFGMGAGPGVFLEQVDRESSLTIDYQLIFGVRWNDVWNRSGFFIESGIKDHFHLLTDGKFTSQFLTAGAVFKL